MDCLKMQERSGNVYENKGPGLHSPAQTGNVIENKDTYELKVGMLLKRKGNRDLEKTEGSRQLGVASKRSAEGRDQSKI
jgi:hypothetical protein